MADKSWWQLLDEWIPTVQDVENTRRGVVDWAGGDGSVGGAIAEGVTSPIKAGVDVTSALGGAIGGAAGTVGGYLSEAGQEAAARGDSRGELDAILSGSRGGAEGGAEAARENINVLDIASMGAGALGSGAMRAAKLATQAGKLGKAASLAKGAGALSKADLGLSAIDAGVGATQVASGIKEGDWTEGLMGAARVAGNTYGAHNSMKDLGEGRGLRSIIDELGLKDTKAPDLGAVADRPPGMSDKEWAEVESADANKALDKGIKGLGIETPTEEGARILAEARSRTSPLEPSKIGFASKKSEAFFNAITNDTSNMLDLEKYFKQLDPAEQADLVQKLQDPDQMKFLGRPITEVDKNTKSANADAVRRLLGERALDQTPEQYGLMRAQDFLRRVAKDRPAALDPASYVPTRLMKASVRDGVVTEEWDDIARLRPDGATMSTVGRGKVAGSPNDEYTIEAVDRGGNRSRTTERDLGRLESDPEYKGTHDEIAAYVRQLEEDLTESSIAQMSDIKWWQQGARNYPTQKLYQWAGKLRGFIHGGTDYGMTYLPGSKGRRYNEVGAGNAYWISPRNIATHAKQIVDLAIEPGAIDPSMLGKLDSLFGEQEKIYLDMVRSGEIERVPEFELQMKAKMTMEQLKYTAAHEALGHNHPQSDHFENYRTEIHDPESYGRGTSVGNLETEALDSFTLANNWLVKHMADPTQLKGIKAIESGPTFNGKRVKWYKQIMPEDDPGYTLKTTQPMSRKAGRTAGIDQIKAANEEFGLTKDTPETDVEGQMSLYPRIETSELGQDAPTFSQTMYHGAAERFGKFSAEKSGSMTGSADTGLGAFLTNEADEAGAYAAEAREASRKPGSGDVSGTVVTLKKPFVIHADELDDNWREILKAKTGFGNSDYVDYRQIKQTLTEAGHDGIVIMRPDGRTHAIVLNPENLSPTWARSTLPTRMGSEEIPQKGIVFDQPPNPPTPPGSAPPGRKLSPEVNARTRLSSFMYGIPGSARREALRSDLEAIKTLSEQSVGTFGNGTITLYRGGKIDPNNPIQSWTTNPEIAARYGARTGVTKAEIPVERILGMDGHPSFPKGHSASYGESEVAVASEEILARARGGGSSDLPPGSTPSGGEPFGPQLRPLAERIRTSLQENRKVNILNDQRTREVQNLKAQALQKIDDELASGRMTHDESVIATKKVREGAFGLQETVDALPITQAEKQMMTERLAQVQQADRQIRANNRIIWDKMLKGERLTAGEVKSITEALAISVEEASRTPLIKRILESGMNFIGGSRALMSSYDLSAAGRQALFASVMNPREAARAFKAQIDALRMTPKEFAAFMDTFDDPSLNPYRDLQKAAGLHISHQKGVDMQEEAFLRASWAEKIPGVLRSEQAYIAYLNKMRVELFNKSVKQLTDSGVPIVDADGVFNPIFQDVAYMVNTLTGRGEMSAVHISKGSGQGKLLGLNATVAPGADAMKNMHQGLTSVFFAPRFAASRAAILRDATLGMVGGNLEAPVYKMYMKNVYGTIGVMSSLAAAVVATGAGTFNADPSKKDFGVLRVGKVRYDLYGGLKPWAKLGISLTQDTYPDSKNRQKAYGSYGGKTHTTDVTNFVRGKLSPPASFLLEAITGEDFMGNKSTAFNKAYSHFTPMILQTITEAIAEGEAEQLPLAVPAAVLGIGVNTYGDRRNR